MTKFIAFMAMVAFAGISAADLAYFTVQGPSLSYHDGTPVPVGVIPQGATVVMGDITGLVTPDSNGNGGFEYNPSLFYGPAYVADLAVKPPFLGGGYAAVFSVRPAADFGVATFIADLNGGGICYGDPIALATITISDMAAEGTPAPTDPELLDGGALTVIPEPASIGLMGLFAGGAFFVRRVFAAW